MNIYKIITLILILSSRANALSPYNALYDLFADTSMGNFKIGIAEFSLETDGENYTYTSVASTKSMWSALYKFSRNEQSIGTNSYNELVSRKYTVNELLGDNAEKNIKIDFFPEKNYATYNNNEKWKISPGNLVDELSVYLALSQDISNHLLAKEFIYQVGSEDKVKFQTFNINGKEKITINDETIDTILVDCPELNLTLNLSEKHNYLPVLIKKTNKKNNFRIVLNSIEFKT
jgi:hypothetical protein